MKWLLKNNCPYDKNTFIYKNSYSKEMLNWIEDNIGDINIYTRNIFN